MLHIQTKNKEDNCSWAQNVCYYKKYMYFCTVDKQYMATLVSN